MIPYYLYPVSAKRNYKKIVVKVGTNVLTEDDGTLNIRQINDLTAQLAAVKRQGIDVILDDRDLRPGVMFAEWELIGVPVRITVGDRGLANGQVEVLSRHETTAELVDLPDVAARVAVKLGTQVA